MRHQIDMLIVGAERTRDLPGGANRFIDGYASAFPGHLSVEVARFGTSSTDTEFDLGDMRDRLGKRLLACYRLHRSVTPARLDSHFVLYGLAAWLGFRSHGQRPQLIVHFQGPWASESASQGASAISSRVKLAIERFFYRRASVALVLSQSFKDVLERSYGVNPSRIRVVPPGLDIDHFQRRPRSDARARLSVAESVPLIVCVRRLVPRMGILDLIDALATLDVAHLLIVGDGPQREELQAHAERIAPGRVRFLGKASEEVLLDAYSAADLSAIPTRSMEGFGLIALESMAMGTPVVARPVDGLIDALAGAPRGAALTPDMTVDSLAETISKLLRSPADRAALREHASHFTWQRCASESLAAITEAAPTSRAT